MDLPEPAAAAAAPSLSSIYERALPQVYGYLRARCDSDAMAEDLTSATFVQAALRCEREPDAGVTIPWLVTVARHKLIDHWRRASIAQRSLTVLEGGAVPHDDPWDAVLDHTRTQQVMGHLAPDHRAALTLRYLDDLSVPECAELLGRSVHATESLLVRARRQFRSQYDHTSGAADQRGGIHDG